MSLFLLVIATASVATAQNRHSAIRYDPPSIVAPAPGEVVPTPNTLRFRWIAARGPTADEHEKYRQVYQRLLVKSRGEGQSLENAIKQNRVVLELLDMTHPYRPGQVHTRLYPADTSDNPLPDGEYVWMVRLIGQRTDGSRRILASSRVGSFVVNIDEEGTPPVAGRREEPAPFGLHFEDQTVDAQFFRLADRERATWRIDVQSSTYPVVLRWDQAALSESGLDGDVRLVDARTGGEEVNANMLESETVHIDNPTVTALEVRLGPSGLMKTRDQTAVTLLAKGGTPLAGASSFGAIFDEYRSPPGEGSLILVWGGSIALGPRRNVPMNFRLTGLNTSGTLVSVREDVESDTDPVPVRLLTVTANAVVRPFPQFLAQPYAIGGGGVRRVGLKAQPNLPEGSRLQPAAHVGVGMDVRLGRMTVGLEVVDYVTGLIQSSEEVRHDVLGFLVLGVPLF